MIGAPFFTEEQLAEAERRAYRDMVERAPVSMPILGQGGRQRWREGCLAVRADGFVCGETEAEANLFPHPLCQRHLNVTLAIAADHFARERDRWERDRPPPKPIDAREGVCYFARFADGRIKIGTTTNLRKRMTALGGPEVLATISGGYLAERAMHDRFAHLRQGRTEMFEAAADLHEYIAGVVAKQEARA